MLNSKLIQLFRTLNDEEVRRFHKFLQSPYHNSNQSILSLFRYIKKSHPLYQSDRLHKERVFEKLFPSKSFNPNKIRKLMSALYKLAEDFLLLIDLENSKYRRKKALAKIYQHRGINHLFEKHIQELIEMFQSDGYRDRTYYFELMQLYRDLYFQADISTPFNPEFLRKAMKTLDIYYGLSKLQLNAEMQTRKQIWDESFDLYLEEENKNLEFKFAPNSNILSNIYLRILALHGEQAGPETFEEALQDFRKIIPQIRRKERQSILQHLLNYCIRSINSGNDQYQEELFKLYQLGLEHDLMMENKQMSEIAFSNIVALSTSLNELTWSKQFIEDFSPYLKEEIQAEIKALSYGFLYFHQKDYNKVIHALQLCKFKDIRNLLKSKCLLLRTYFDQFEDDNTYFEFLIDQTLAFEKYVRRVKVISKEKVQAYLNFIKYSRKIAQSRMSGKSVVPLKSQLLAQNRVSYKPWLLEKLAG